MSGRPRKPTALKLLAGNPGKRPINKREPKIASSSPPRCPKHLNAQARKEWRRILRSYRQVGLLCLLDRAALIGYCTHYARAIEADEALVRTGLVIRTTNGNIIQSPLVGISNKAWTEVRKWATEFGFTPVARTRLEMPEQVEESDFAKHLKQSGQMR